MMFKLISICSLLFALNTLAADPCSDPFSGERTQFKLTETLTCNPTQSFYRLDINPNAYLEPACIGNHKVLDLYLNNGQNIRSFSNEQIGNSGWGDLQVSSACTGQNLFIIKPDYQIPGIGFVNPEENTVNNIILRNNQTQIIANASRHLISEGSCGKAIWNVDNSAGLSPQVMSYLLALKDNQLFSCDTLAPNPGPSTGSSIVLGIVFGTFIAIPATILIVRMIWLKCPKWFKRKYDLAPSNTGENLQSV